MNTSRGRSAMALSFVYFRQASCKSQDESTSTEKLNPGLQMSDDCYEARLLHCASAACSWKSYMPPTPSEDCTTARAIVQSSATPSITTRSSHVIERSCTKTGKEAAKNFVYEAPSAQKLKDWIESVAEHQDDPEMLRFYIFVLFQVLTIPAASDKYRVDIVSTARAIEQLSTNSAFKSTVDRVFGKALEDYTNDLCTQNIDRYAAARGPDFAKKVDQYLSNNSLLKEKYQRIKKQITRELRNASLTE